MAHFAGSVEVFLAALLMIGVVAAIAGAWWAVVLLLVGFVGVLGVHLLAGALHYREVMRRPWPKVQPLEDEDDW